MPYVFLYFVEQLPSFGSGTGLADMRRGGGLKVWLSVEVWTWIDGSKRPNGHGHIRYEWMVVRPHPLSLPREECAHTPHLLSFDIFSKGHDHVALSVGQMITQHKKKTQG